MIGPAKAIRIGTMINATGGTTTERLAELRHLGFESFEPIFCQTFVFMRTPGFGDSNWTDIISELRLAGWTASIDIEGWHDPVYRDELEMTGQVHALNHLKQARGGDQITLAANCEGGDPSLGSAS